MMGSYWKLILLVFMMVVLVSMGAKDDDKPEEAVEGGDKPKGAEGDDDDEAEELKKKALKPVISSSKDISVSLGNLPQWSTYTTVVMGYANKPLNYSECVCSFTGEGLEQGIDIPDTDLVDPLKMPRHIPKLRNVPAPQFPPRPKPLPKKGIDVAAMLRKIEALQAKFKKTKGSAPAGAKKTFFLETDQTVKSSFNHSQHGHAVLNELLNGEEMSESQNTRIAEALASLSQEDLYAEMVRLYAEQGVDIASEFSRSSSGGIGEDSSETTFIELNVETVPGVNVFEMFMPTKDANTLANNLIGQIPRARAALNRDGSVSLVEELASKPTEADDIEIESGSYSNDDYMKLAKAMIYGE